MREDDQALKIVIVDDQQAAVDVIAAQAEKCEQVTVELATTDAFEAVRFCRKNPIDAVFLDIRMDVMNGFEFIEQLKNPPAIILTTAFKEFALEGHEVGVVDYLVKPVDFGQFARAVQRVEDRRGAGEPAANSNSGDGNPRIALKIEHKEVLVDLKHIIWLHADKNETWVHVLGRDYKIHDVGKVLNRVTEVLSVNIPFGKLYDSLPHPQFVQVHRSHVVALKMIHEFHGGYLKLHHLPDKHIPVSDTYRPRLEQLLA